MGAVVLVEGKTGKETFLSYLITFSIEIIKEVAFI